MTKSTAQKAPRRFPIMEGILPINRAQIPIDIIAGVTLAALAIPEVMGYTQIAGMPVITGLYTILIPIALFALLGSSRHLVVGADSATAAIMAAGLAGLAATSSSEYVALAGLLALITAVILLLARLIKLGFLADFLSRTVLIGFLTGVGIQVAIGQISGMLGIPGGGSGPVQKLATDIQQLSQTNIYTLAISVGVLAIILGARRINKKIPGALIAVIGAIAISYFFNLSSYGVAVLGTVPGGLPSFGLPDVTISWSLIQQLLPTAFSMFIVILAQSAATSRAYAARYSETFDENVDLVGLSLANIGAGLTGTFVVNGSPTKTQMVDSAGGRSQVAMLTTSVIVIIVLLFLTVPLSYMPEAVLSSVVFLIGIELVDLLGMRKIYAARKAEFWVALITAAVVVFIGVEQGILLAMVLSLFIHVAHGYKPKNFVMTQEDGHLRTAPVTEPSEILPGLVYYRFTHSMYYANSERLSEEVLSLLDTEPGPVVWLCIDMDAVDDVDYSAGATLLNLYDELKERGVQLLFTAVHPDVREDLERYGVVAAVGPKVFFDHASDLLDAYKQKKESN